MIIKILKKIAGVIFSISKDLKAIRKTLGCQNKPLIIKGEFKPFETIEEFQKYINSHKWIEEYIDERLDSKAKKNL